MKSTCLLLLLPLFLLVACSQDTASMDVAAPPPTPPMRQSPSRLSLANIVPNFTLGESSRLHLKGIQEIPAEVFTQTQLTALSVYGQDCDIAGVECLAIEEVPMEIGQLTQLEELHLTLNYIEELPETMLKLDQLRVLDLSENPNFSDIETVSQLSGLNEFYCYGCGLSNGQVEQLAAALPNCKIGVE